MQDFDQFLHVLFVTHGIPYAITSVVIVGWSLLDRTSTKERVQNAIIGFLWCTAVAAGVNFLFIDTPYRIALFLLVSIGGVVFVRCFNRRQDHE
jgi:hypothetical protein